MFVRYLGGTKVFYKTTILVQEEGVKNIEVL
jgi:hypothetical protein